MASFLSAAALGGIRSHESPTQVCVKMINSDNMQYVRRACRRAAARHTHATPTEWGCISVPTPGLSPLQPG